MVYITVHSLCCMFCGFEQMYNDMCAFQVVLVVKNPSANAGDVRDVGDSWVRKIPWREAWHPLLYSCLENPTDRGA